MRERERAVDKYTTSSVLDEDLWDVNHVQRKHIKKLSKVLFVFTHFVKNVANILKCSKITSQYLIIT